MLLPVRHVLLSNNYYCYRSSRIGHFVDTIKQISDNKKSRLKITNINDEFLKVFKLYDLDLLNDSDPDFEEEGLLASNRFKIHKKTPFEN